MGTRTQDSIAMSPRRRGCGLDERRGFDQRDLDRHQLGGRRALVGEAGEQRETADVGGDDQAEEGAASQRRACESTCSIRRAENAVGPGRAGMDCRRFMSELLVDGQ